MTTAAHPTSIEHVIGAGGTCVLRVRSGDTRLIGIPGDTVRIRSMDGRPLDTFDVDAADGRLTVQARGRVDLPFGRSGGIRTVDLVVEVPARATLVLEGASGDIQANGLIGEQRYRTASGDIRLTGAGGTISAEGVSGDIDVTAIATLALTARTVSGDLSVRAATITSLRATTTSGDVRVAGRLDGPGPFNLETVSGDALLAPANDIRLEGGTVVGDIHADVPARTEGAAGQRVLVTGAGGPTISFRSMSGDLRLVRATALPDVDTSAAPDPADAPSDATASAQPDETPATPRRPVGSSVDPDEDARLTILRALEHGEIDVVEAGRRLEALDG